MSVLDFYVYSPSGQKFRSTREVTKYLESNPDVKCDLNVTNTNNPKRKSTNKHLNEDTEKSADVTETAVTTKEKKEYSLPYGWKKVGNKRNRKSREMKTNKHD